MGKETELHISKTVEFTKEELLDAWAYQVDVDQWISMYRIMSSSILSWDADMKV